MDFAKLNPWNWFKHEEEQAGDEKFVPVERSTTNTPAQPATTQLTQHPIAQFHRDIDRLFEDAFRSFGVPSIFDRGSLFKDNLWSAEDSALIKPQVDIATDENQYKIVADLPGLNDDAVKLEVSNGTLTISGEKKQENEEKDQHFYRVERSYGAFRRVLTLPEDANEDEIEAKLKDGVLTVSIPRRQLPKPDVKQIEIKTQ